MKAFEFRLEKLLRLREFDEERAKIELGKAVSKVEKLKYTLEEIAKEKISTHREMGSDQFELESFIASEHYLQMLNEKKEVCIRKLAEAELEAEQMRILFAEAMKKRKILTKLKEKKESSWKKEVRKEEENFIDDIVNSKST